MPAQVGDIVTASCSQCKENADAEVVAAVGAEIVTVTCKTCGTSQRYRPASDAKARPAAGRRVVDVGSGGSEAPKPRSRTPRRVLSSTGREIRDDAPIRTMSPMPSRDLVAAIQPAPVARPAGLAAMKNDDLFRRWDAMTAGLLSRHGRPHRSHESYREGEIILHTVHGMGIVEQVRADGLLTVLFRRGYQELPSRPREEPASPKA